MIANPLKDQIKVEMTPDEELVRTYIELFWSGSTEIISMDFPGDKVIIRSIWTPPMSGRPEEDTDYMNMSAVRESVETECDVA